MLEQKMSHTHKQSRKRLWESNKQTTLKDFSTVQSVFRLYASRPSTIRFFTLCCNGLAVVQEFSLTCFVLARHRMVWLQQQQQQQVQRSLLEASNLFLVVALLVAVVYGNAQPKTQDRRTKVRQRITDSFLLAFVLRFASSFLQSLTASYSSDTVHRLALLGMSCHVLVCDYSYANGHATIQASNVSRPIFGGGTFALNAALFSTTLLVSRIHDNQTVFLFISLSVVVFAFYSTTRHDMARTHPAHSSGTSYFASSFLSTLIGRLSLSWFLFSGSLAHYSIRHHGDIVLNFRRSTSRQRICSLHLCFGFVLSSLEVFPTAISNVAQGSLGCGTGILIETRLGSLVWCTE